LFLFLRNKYYDAGTAISSSPLETEYNLGGKPAKNQVITVTWFKVQKFLKVTWFQVH